VRTAKLLALSLVVTAAACSRGQKDGDTALASDLQRDLQLATTSVALPAAPARNDFALETAPTSAPAPATTLRRSSGPRAVRSPQRQVAAAPEPTPAESEEQVAQVTETPSATEAAAEPSSEGVALPRPTAIPIDLPASGGSGPQVVVQDDGNGRGGMGGIGGIFGVVIRGGGVDGDNCEIHDRRRTRGRPVYRPNPGGIAGGRTPMIGRGTFPRY
jgi:hypothetical protein